MTGASRRRLSTIAGAGALVAFAAAMWWAAALATFWADHDGVITGGFVGLALAALAGVTVACPARLRTRLALVAAVYAVHALALARLAAWHAANPDLARAFVADAVALALVVAAGQRWSPAWLATLACTLLLGWSALDLVANAFAPYGTSLVAREAVDGIVFALGAIGRHLATVWDAPAAAAPAR